MRRPAPTSSPCRRGTQPAYCTGINTTSTSICPTEDHKEEQDWQHATVFWHSCFLWRSSRTGTKRVVNSTLRLPTYLLGFDHNFQGRNGHKFDRPKNSF